MATVDIAKERAQRLVDPLRCSRFEDTGYGYFDTLGGSPPTVHSLAQRLMRTRFYSAGYQIGRPIAFRLAGGPSAPGRDEDRARVASWLGLRPGSILVDVGCGPGNFTGWFGTQIGPEGLAVGVDASHTMLRRAVVDNAGPNVAYLRGDAENLPFADGIADAAVCAAALYLINQPHQAVAELARVLKPGGRIVILTSLVPRVIKGAIPGAALNQLTGVRWFGRREITGLLGRLGFSEIEQRVHGLSQIVVATKSTARDRCTP